jgi:hypothetical protein
MTEDEVQQSLWSFYNVVKVIEAPFTNGRMLVIRSDILTIDPAAVALLAFGLGDADSQPLNLSTLIGFMNPIFMNIKLRFRYDSDL